MRTLVDELPRGVEVLPGDNRMMRFRWWHVAIVMAVSVGFVLALFTVAEIGRSKLTSAAADVRRAQIQLVRVVDLHQTLTNVESAHRWFLVTSDPRYLEPMATASEQIDTLATQLATTYRGRDTRVGDAIRQLDAVADARMAQMAETVALHREQGPAAALAVATSASRHDTMDQFRELAAITRDYEQSLVDRSLTNWDRELEVVHRLNLATLAVGLLLSALAVTVMRRSIRQREEAAVELVRQHDELKAQADAQSTELTELHRHLQHVQEEERARLSRGLHDELGGMLLAARMDVTWLQNHPSLAREEVDARLERVRQAIDQGIDLKRRVVEELRPTLLDTMGLVPALRWQIQESCNRANLKCREQFPDEELKFNRAGAITLFRVVQEALANILKHARATEVAVALDTTGEDVIVTIQDDGVGAAREDLGRPRAHGIAGMRHRVHVIGGQLDIVSAPGRGTRIRVRVPRARVMEASGADAGSSGEFAAIPWPESSGSAA